ncbi:protein of unknown function [Burkholderia multivorans]
MRAQVNDRFAVRFRQFIDLSQCDARSGLLVLPHPVSSSSPAARYAAPVFPGIPRLKSSILPALDSCTPATA